MSRRIPPGRAHAINQYFSALQDVRKLGLLPAGGYYRKESIEEMVHAEKPSIASSLWMGRRT